MMNHYEEANRYFEVWMETHDEYSLISSLEHLVKAKSNKEIITWLQDYILKELG